MVKKGSFSWILILCLGWAAIPAGESQSQGIFPARPITLLVGYAPGGISDTAARALLPAAAKLFGQPVVVVNKPGAGATIAFDFLESSKPDGYTLLNGGTMGLASGMYTHGAKWGPRSFTMILGHAINSYALVVRSDAPWKTFDEWVQYVRQNPGFKYGAHSPQGATRLMVEWIGKRLGLKLVPVYYKGDGEAIPNLLGGHVQAIIAVGGHAAHVKAGKMRTLLQVTGETADPDPKRVAQMKDVFPDAPMEMVDLPQGIFGPKGIPESIKTRLHDVFKKASIENPEFIRANQLMNITVQYYSPEKLQEIVIKGHEYYGKLLKEFGVEIK